MRQFCEALKRAMVLGDRLGWDMRKSAVIERVLASFEPHPDLGKPRLWALGANDRGAQMMDWPLRNAADVPADEAPAAPPADRGRLVPFPAAREGW